MNINNISLNMYSFGYAAGFLGNNKQRDKVISLDDLVKKSDEFGLAGIEFPFDRYFGGNNLTEGIDYLTELSRKKVKFFLDFENFNTDFMIKAIPKLAFLGISLSRIKMDQIGKTIYGGNRHMMSNFEEMKNSFMSKLTDINPYLKEYEFTLAIENHQDLHSNELIEIIESIDGDHLGINWDVGNSISCLDTPDSFYENTKDFIRNVHLKDYKIYCSKNGIRLVRCPIGSGYVNYEKILNSIDRNENIMSYSIELGAQITRECYINEETYWNAFTSLPIPRESYEEYVNSILSEDGETFSSYESGMKGQKLFQSEIDDVHTSVDNLSLLAANL